MASSLRKLQFGCLTIDLQTETSPRYSLPADPRTTVWLCTLCISVSILIYIRIIIITMIIIIIMIIIIYIYIHYIILYYILIYYIIFYYINIYYILYINVTHTSMYIYIYIMNIHNIYIYT